MTTTQEINDVQPDLAAVKARQQRTWSAGDYAIVGATLQIVGEQLCEAADLRAGDRVLDVATGNGGTAIAAARRFCDVTGTDYVPELLDRARERARAERFTIAFDEGDAEQLPYDDAKLRRRAVDLRRDVRRRPGPRRGRAAAGLPSRRRHRAGQLDADRLHRPAVQDDRRAQPAARRRGVAVAVGHRGPPARAVRRQGSPSSAPSRAHFVFRYRSAEHFLDVFRTYYGPMLKAFEALDDAGRDALAADLAGCSTR